MTLGLARLYRTFSAPDAGQGASVGPATPLPNKAGPRNASTRTADQFERGIVGTTASALRAQPQRLPRSDYALCPGEPELILRALDAVRSEFAWVPRDVVFGAPWGAQIMQEMFDGSNYQLSIRVPKDVDAQKHALVERLNGQLAGTGLRAIDSGEVVNITNARVCKSIAASDYARALGVPVVRIAKFGDKAGPHGNDKHLMDRNAYNVGNDVPAIAAVDCSHQGEHAAGVVAIVDRLLAEKDGASPQERARLATRAFMFDFDGTLTRRGETVIAPEALAMLVRLVERGEKFVICSGRGASLLDAAVKPLLDAGIPIEKLSRSMSVMLFNGARSLRLDELLAYARAE